ncbi:MAG: hypothetical protein IH995_10050 [Proteobacteria bacterium]|nr:hypothetical protein [Pseudomonadota bacterium]
MFEAYFEAYFNLLPGTWFASFIYSLFPIIVSGVFLLKDKNENKATHYAVSLHGVMISALFFFSWAVLGLGWSGEKWLILLFSMPIIMIFSIIFSYFKFTGNKKLHLLHLITLFLTPYLWLWALMAYMDDWL